MFPSTDDPAKVPELSPGTLADYLGRVEEMTAWIKDINAEALARVQSGLGIPGYKMVIGRAGNRAWGDKTAVESQLLMLLDPEAIYEPRQIVSPTAAEKLLKKMPAEWAALQDSIIRPEGRATLVRDSDKRQGLQSTASSFEDISLL